MPATEIPAGDSTIRMTSIEHAMEELRRFPRAQWLDLVRSDQSHRWRQGIVVLAEDYFRRLPELRADAEEALVLISGEILLRQEVGAALAVEQFQERFPELRDRIALQFQVNRILDIPLGAGAADATDRRDNVDLPGFEFLDEIGRGASGVVYKARQESLDRFVAIKVVPIPGAGSKQLLRQRQEAEILARLHHASVVHIYEVRDFRGCLYLVMEYVAGTTLADNIRGRATAPAEAARVTLSLAETIHAVHEAGILHRDLKPSNVLRSASGELKVTDFGLAKLRSGDVMLTAPDSVLGTPSYMAPEQAAGGTNKVGPTADVYSLGAILYELLTGRPPFLGATVLDTLALIRTDEPVAPRRLQPRLSRDLETICLKCLAKAPHQRYETAAALAEDLRRFLAGGVIVARRPGLVERSFRLAKRRPLASITVACCLALAGVIGEMAWRATAHERQLSAAALVESIATADAQVLPQLLDKLPPQPDVLLPIIREALATSGPPDSKWVNLSVAELTADAAASEGSLLKYLPAARPAEISLILPVLAGRAAAVRQEVWRQLEEDAVTDDARLNLACLAAQVSPDDARWAAIAPAVARALILEHPLDMGAFTAALAPARKALVPSLDSLYRNPNLEPIAREVTAGILARLAFDQPSVLADVIAEADASAFRLVLPAIQQQASAALPHLESVANAEVDFGRLARERAQATRHEVQQVYDAAERRRATAMIAMWHLVGPENALEAMQRGKDPALRSWLIELLAPLGISIDTIWADAEVASDASVRQALLLAIGQGDFQGLGGGEQDRLITDLLQMYRDDPDAGVHAACGWLLRTRLHAAEVIAKVDASLPHQATPNRGWYAGPNGHTLTILRGPAAFTMGSPAGELSREDDEAAHARRIEYSLAIGAEEVAIAQFQRFKRKFFNTRYSATDDCPANNITWFDAAAYCRWLSEQDGMPEDQMCYPPVAEIGPEMHLPDNWRERTGYRLPTEAEWEYACRGDVTASRFCGEGKELLGRYAWFQSNSDDHAWPVGQLKPNAFGLFDMLGNVTERCQDAMETYPGAPKLVASPATAPELTVDATATRGFRGGNFGDAEHNLRSARRNANGVQDQWALVGFRIARRL